MKYSNISNQCHFIGQIGNKRTKIKEAAKSMSKLLITMFFNIFLIFVSLMHIYRIILIRLWQRIPRSSSYQLLFSLTIRL